jgi:DNA-binding GntR family transcriptional regulator
MAAWMKANVHRTSRRPARPTPHGMERASSFLYTTVAQELKRRIGDQTYAPGTRIPTEGELVREFNVSAITVRRAIRNLTTEGLLFGRQGLGVFVASGRRIVRSFGSDMRVSLADEVRRAGFEPSLRVRSLALVPGDAEVTRRLGMGLGSLLYRYEAILLANGEAIGLDLAYVPRKLGDLVREDLAHSFIFSALRSRGIRMDHVDYQFQAGVASEEEASVLSLPVGFPLLVVHFTLINPDGAAIVTGRTVSRADRFTYAFCGREEIHPGLGQKSSGHEEANRSTTRRHMR